MNNSKLGFAIISVTLVLSTGCGDGETHAFDNASTIQAALFESTCWTNTTADATFDAYFLWPDTHVKQSPNPNYDHPNCDRQWVVDVTGINGWSFSPSGGSIEQGYADPTWCPGWWARVNGKGWKNGAWHDLGSYGTVGEWRCDFGHCRCASRLTEGAWPTPTVAQNGYEKLRVVTAAGFATSYGRAQGGLRIHSH